MSLNVYQIFRTVWYTAKYVDVANLMMLDGIITIPGKFTDFVNYVGYAMAFIKTFIDFTNHIAKGKSFGYIFASGVFTLVTEISII